MLTCRAYPYGPCKQQTLRLSKPSCYKRWQNSSVPQSSHTCAPAVGIKSTEDAVGYVLRQPKLRQLLGAEQPEDLTAVELDGGKLNYVFHIKSAHAQRTKKDPIHGNNSVHGSTDTNQIENDMSSPSSTAATRGHTFEEHQSAMKQHINGSETSLLLKYTPPYVKAAGTSFYLTQERLKVEAAAMKAVFQHSPALIPAVLFHDDEASVLCVQFLPHPHIKVIEGIHQHHLVYPQLAHDLADLMATFLYHTSKEVLTPDQYAEYCLMFANKDVKDANERVVLTDSFDPDCPANKVLDDPELALLVSQLRDDPVVREAVQELVDKYRNEKQALIHNDLHTGNLLGTPDGSLYLIDWEFATMGPASFDLGCVLGCFLLAWVTVGWSNDFKTQTERQVQRAWLADSIPQFWHIFVNKYGSLKRLDVDEAHAADFDEAWMWRDAIGYAALYMVRLTVGMHNYAGYDMDVPVQHMTQAQVAVLKLAQSILHMRMLSSCNVEDLHAMLV